MSRQMAEQTLRYARDLKRIADLERTQARELAVATERLQRMDRLKTDFLCFISHELRTPLTPMGMIDWLDIDGLDGTAREVLGLVKDGYRRLHRFVSRSIELFDTLADDDDWATETSDIYRLTRDALEILDGQASLDLDLPDDQCLVTGVSRAIEQIIRIVFENVLKHADGQPAAAISLRNDGSVARLTVTDSGKGFQPEMASEITRPFTPADVMHHREGTTLSLALAAQLAERCGGSLRVMSDGPGNGATVLLELPSAGDLPGQE